MLFYLFTANICHPNPVKSSPSMSGLFVQVVEKDDIFLNDYDIHIVNSKLGETSIFLLGVCPPCTQIFNIQQIRNLWLHLEESMQN